MSHCQVGCKGAGEGHRDMASKSHPRCCSSEHLCLLNASLGLDCSCYPAAEVQVGDFSSKVLRTYHSYSASLMEGHSTFLVRSSKGEPRTSKEDAHTQMSVREAALKAGEERIFESQSKDSFATLPSVRVRGKKLGTSKTRAIISDCICLYDTCTAVYDTDVWQMGFDFTATCVFIHTYRQPSVRGTEQRTCVNRVVTSSTAKACLASHPPHHIQKHPLVLCEYTLLNIEWDFKSIFALSYYEQLKRNKRRDCSRLCSFSNISAKVNTTVDWKHLSTQGKKKERKRKKGNSVSLF